MGKIIISPWSRKLRIPVSYPNPKDYPWWTEVVENLSQRHELIQIGVEGEAQICPVFLKNLPLKILRTEVLGTCDTWISVDNFFHHLAWIEKKPGVVIFGQSDPLIYGHPENINLLKSREFLRTDQFGIWESAPYKIDAFVEPQAVVAGVEEILNMWIPHGKAFTGERGTPGTVGRPEGSPDIREGENLEPDH